ncbi:DUF2796 domain-containing protein [Exilibacterium tricleocarpae]|uniref:DUF2796 domain-containing protein n=1 Tax=Exilibacterium tricleocarpae TaxID=2591008 RepID=A0A545T035_9GAMM|nr:DUF2796 domain-containing protein [Exilibacterium tricleocarpae]TQV70582.1 DUF2796 domain-containing protein [Exilibacterium tricleocarpae]
MESSVRCSMIFIGFSVLIITTAEAQKAHVHGTAVLTLAVEYKNLEIQFESPATNLVGFEHDASSPDEKQAVKQAEAILESSDLLFSFFGTSCEPEETTVDMAGVTGDQHGHHDHSRGHNESTHSESTHSEIRAHYRFVCKDAESLKSVSTALFHRFPGIEAINAIWVSASQQGTEWLRPDRNTFSLNKKQ